MKFPLPAGHVYGSNPFDIAYHDGTASTIDCHYLWVWQREYAKTDRDFHPSGVFDGPTQRAAIAVQRAHGLTITSTVDESTWDALLGVLRAPQSPVEVLEAPVQPEAPEGLPKASPPSKASQRPKRALGSRIEFAPGFAT